MSRKNEEPAKNSPPRYDGQDVTDGENSKQRSKRIPKGYGFQPFEKPLIRKLCQTSLPISAGVALTDWAWVLTSMYVGSVLIAHVGWVWALLAHVFLLWPLCSRALRGFENLTHEGSHSNLDRRSKGRNDGFVNWSCSYWVLISVEMFRATHELHHKYFGSDNDPDKRRFARLGIDDMPRQSPGRLAAYLLRKLPVYIVDYWKQFSDESEQLKKSLALHLLFMGLGSWLVYENFWLLWLAHFWFPFVCYLPVLRFIAEAEEHRYKDAETEFGSTFSNLSGLQRWFFHPHGDAYHLLHHMLPQVPHWKMAYAHWLLATLDMTFQSGRYRKSIFDAPRRYLKTIARHAPAMKG